MGKFTTGPAVKNHISPKMARTLIARHQTVYHLSSLVLSTSSSTTSTPTSSASSSQDYVISTERSGSTSAESRGNPLHKPVKIENTSKKKKETKKYRAIYCMTCRTGCRSSERIWLMKEVLWSHGETRRQGIETLPVLLINYQWSRDQRWKRARASTAFTLTSRRHKMAISAWRRK